MRLKDKLYKINCVVWIRMLAVDKKIERRMNVTEMRMLRWMRGVTRGYSIRIAYVRRSIGVVSIVDKIRENKLRYSHHIWLCYEGRRFIRSKNGYESER